MKSVVIISTVTFLLIFGGVGALVLTLGDRAPAGDAGEGDDPAAAARLLRDAASERDRLQRASEHLASLEASHAAREQLMARIHDQLLATIGRLETRQDEYVEEQENAAVRLAKMYEAMKAQKAAVILSSLELDVTVSILARMKERAAAEVLSFMDAGLAAQISTRLSLQGGA
jgi:flagellar motility protein MotE (MotC chaperone)